MTTRPQPPAGRARPIRSIILATAALAPSLPRAEALEWRPPRGNETTLGDLMSGLLSGGGLAVLLLAALLAALFVGLQLLGSRS